MRASYLWEPLFILPQAHDSYVIWHFNSGVSLQGEPLSISWVCPSSNPYSRHLALSSPSGLEGKDGDWEVKLLAFKSRKKQGDFLLCITASWLVRKVGTLLEAILLSILCLLLLRAIPRSMSSDGKTLLPLCVYSQVCVLSVFNFFSQLPKVVDEY